MTRQNKAVPLHDIETKQLQSLGFNIIDLSAKGKKSYDTNVLHRHTFYELFYFASGNGTHEIDFGSFPLESNSVHFVAPGQIHKLILRKTSGFVLCFTEEFLNLKPSESITEVFPFFDSLHSQFFKLKKVPSAEIRVLIDAINKEYGLAQSQNAELLKHYLSIILLKLKTHFSNLHVLKKQALPDKNQKVVAFKDLINKNYLLHLNVSEYARELSVTPNHLNALCKLHEGRTAIDMIHHRLILEAKRLLYATNLSIKEISYRLKFEDAGYFSRFFKLHTNLTPARYRVGIIKNR